MEPDAAARAAGPRRRLGVGAALALVILAFAVTVVIGIVRTAGAPVETVSATVGMPHASPAVQRLYVHVSGAVVIPGLYVLGAGARVVDAVAAAGGFAADADRAGVNLARPVGDGEQLRVPRQGEGDLDGPPGAEPDGRVNLNTADLATLDTLPRVGPALAQRIVDWREANGSFHSVDDLLDVSGFGPKMVDALREHVTV